MSGAMNVRQKLARGRPLQGHTNAGPSVSILTSAANATQGVPQGGFTGEAADAEQGDLSASIEWSIPSQGSPTTKLVLGTGADVTLTFPYSAVAVTLTATITDSFGATDTDTASVNVSP